MFVNKGKINTSRFFPMLHHEESPEKPQHSMEFSDPPPPFAYTYTNTHTGMNAKVERISTKKCIIYDLLQVKIG